MGESRGLQTPPDAADERLGTAALSHAAAGLHDPELSAPGPADATAKATATTAAFAFDLTDFGDDAYTRGRPHPMIDNTLRLRAVADTAADEGVGVVLLDVVLGRGAHADPAAEIAAAIVLRGPCGRGWRWLFRCAGGWGSAGVGAAGRGFGWGGGLGFLVEC